jgi:hypothetical protein
MKKGRQLFGRLVKRILFLAYVQLIGLVGAVVLYCAVLVLWVAGLFVLPVALLKSTRDHEEIVLPKWAYIWDDTEDLDIRGRPAATFVWDYGLSWPMATFLWLQFYNPLANARMWFRRKQGT